MNGLSPASRVGGDAALARSCRPEEAAREARQAALEPVRSSDQPCSGRGLGGQPGGQGRHHYRPGNPGNRQSLADLDPDLHGDMTGRRQVPVEHDIAAALDPGPPQAGPDFIEHPRHWPGNRSHVVAAATTAIGRRGWTATETS